MNKKRIFLLLPLLAFVFSCSPGPGPSDITPKDGIFDIYAINDTHGMVIQDSSRGEPGITRLATFLDNQRQNNKDGTIFVNSGDLWQGSFDSNVNNGALLTEAMNAMKCDAMTLGNHEFDWGQDNIKEMKSLANYPFLGGNIVDYTTKEQRTDLADTYTVIERKNVKIGIIGMIGEGQTTSVTSQNVSDLEFVDPTQLVINTSKYLKETEKCQIIILSIHCGEYNVSSSIVNDNGKKHVDAVLCGHTHQDEKSITNGVPFVQTNGYGKSLSHVRLALKDGVVSCTSYGNIGYGQMYSLNEHVDTKAVLDKYLNQAHYQKRMENLATLDGSLDYSIGIPRLIAKAAADEALSQGYQIDLAMTNSARASLYTSPISYSEFYRSIPFANIMYITKATYADIAREAAYNSFYRLDGKKIINDGTIYTIAVYDYLLTHQNTNKIYDYFRNFQTSDILGYLKNDDQSIMYPAEVGANYLRQIGSVNANMFNTINYTSLSGN